MTLRQLALVAVASLDILAFALPAQAVCGVEDAPVPPTCPSIVENACPPNAAGGPNELDFMVASSATDIDYGWIGISHNFPLVGGWPLKLCLIQCDTSTNPLCGTCGPTGPGSINGDTLGPPLPLLAANVPVCVINRFTSGEVITGTADLQNGQTNVALDVLSDVFLTTAGEVCPRCSNGACTSGPNVGRACTVDGTVIVAQAAGDKSYPLSRDCPPSAATSQFAGTLAIHFPLTSGTAVCDGPRPCVAKPGDPSVGVPVQDDRCAGGLCNATCTGLACASHTVDGQCIDAKGGISQFCCSTDTTTPCFPTAQLTGVGGRIERTGVSSPPTPVWPDRNYPKTADSTLVSTFCEPATTLSTINTTSGLPGPGALILPGTVVVKNSSVTTSTSTTLRSTTTSTTTTTTTTSTTVLRNVCPPNAAGGANELDLTIANSGTDFDYGWTGTSHNFPLVGGWQVNLCLSDCDTSSDPLCTLEGPTGVGSINTDTFGPPIPLLAANVPVCVTNRFQKDVTGTTNLQTGDVTLTVDLFSDVFLTTAGEVCPRCTNGTCTSGPNADESCTVDSTVTVAQAAGDKTYNVSRDCPPSQATSQFAGSLPIHLPLTSGAASLAGPRPCRAQAGDPSVGVPVQDDQCGGSACNAMCTGLACQTRTSDGKCIDGKGGISQFCCALDTTKPCFPTSTTNVGRIDRAGVPMPVSPPWNDPTFPKTSSGTLVSVFCMPATTSNTINTTSGLPGPGALILPGMVVVKNPSVMTSTSTTLRSTTTTTSTTTTSTLRSTTTTTTSTTSTTLPSECGNGRVEAGEDCDPPCGTGQCPGGQVCTDRCRCEVTTACACGAPPPTMLDFTSAIGSGTCGTMRDDAGNVLPDVCVGGSNSGQPCTTTSDCPVGICSTGSLACGGVYFGGGRVSVPLPAMFPDMTTAVSRVTSCSNTCLTLGGTTAAQAGGNTCLGGSNHHHACITNADCPGGKCNFLHCTNTGCLFGPPLPVTNPPQPQLSTCIVNRIGRDATGTASCATGETPALSVLLNSDIYLTGNLLVFRRCDGSNPGELCDPADTTSCASGGTCEDDSIKHCGGGTNAGAACQADSECPGSKCAVPIRPCPICNPVTSKCNGGPNNGLACTPGDSASLGTAYPTTHDCPPPPEKFLGTLPIALQLTTGTTRRQSVDNLPAESNVFCGFCRHPSTLAFARDRCIGGINANKPCLFDVDCPDGTCPRFRCRGGTNANNQCTRDVDCPGGTCVSTQGVPCSRCSGGSNDGFSCAADGDCPGGTCPSAGDGDCRETCNGGSNPGATCDVPTCGSGGTCSAGGTCTSGPTPGALCCAGGGRCLGGYTSCQQHTTGAFGQLARTIEVTGKAAGSLSDRRPHDSTLVSVLCIPPALQQIDAAEDLPGPGVLSFRAAVHLLPTVTSGLLGDCNVDTTFDLFDILVKIDIVLGRVTPTPTQMSLCDDTCDGTIDIFDILREIDALLGRIPTPLACPAAVASLSAQASADGSGATESAHGTVRVQRRGNAVVLHNPAEAVRGLELTLAPEHGPLQILSVRPARRTRGLTAVFHQPSATAPAKVLLLSLAGEPIESGHGRVVIIRTRHRAGHGRWRLTQARVAK